MNNFKLGDRARYLNGDVGLITQVGETWVLTIGTATVYFPAANVDKLLSPVTEENVVYLTAHPWYNRFKRHVYSQTVYSGANIYSGKKPKEGE